MDLDNFDIPKILHVLLDFFNGIDSDDRNDLSVKEKEAEENIRQILIEYRNGYVVFENELVGGKFFYDVAM